MCVNVCVLYVPKWAKGCIYNAPMIVPASNIVLVGLNLTAKALFHIMEIIRLVYNHPDTSVLDVSSSKCQSSCSSTVVHMLGSLFSSLSTLIGHVI